MEAWRIPLCDDFQHKLMFNIEALGILTLLANLACARTKYGFRATDGGQVIMTSFAVNTLFKKLEL